MRLFAAITPPAEVLDHLEKALGMLGPLPPPAARSGRGARGHSRHLAARSPWTPRSTWHLTLAFFGDVPDGAAPDLEAAVAAAVRDVEPFTIHLAGAGAFRSTAMWVGVGGETDPLVGAIHELIDVRDELTAMRDARERNRAHLTISRAGASVDSAHVTHALAVYRGPEWTVDAVELIESHLGQGAQGRPVHTVLASVPLGLATARRSSRGRQHGDEGAAGYDDQFVPALGEGGDESVGRGGQPAFHPGDGRA